MSEVPLLARHVSTNRCERGRVRVKIEIQGYLARKKLPPPYNHRRVPGIVLLKGPRGEAVSCERGTPVQFQNGGTALHRKFGTKSGRAAARADDAQGTPTQSHTSPSILVYEYNQVSVVGLCTDRSAPA